MIDWTDPSSQISKHFTVKEALWLPSWNRMATEDDGLTEDIKANILAHATKMDTVRDILGPLIVHCFYRPPAYNKLVGGAPGSAHQMGKAMDFHASNHSIQEAKDLIVQNNLLESLDIRMEAGTPTWIHLGNDYTQGHNRIFQP